MNWTGGRLSRHSRGGAAALNQRQKAHFARVQINLRNGTKKESPIKWSVFGKIHVQQTENERQSSCYPGSRPITHGAPRESDDRHTSRDRYESQSREPHQAPPPIPGPLKQCRVPENDLYSVTPQPQAKRKREISVPEDSIYGKGEEDWVSEKRKKLLQKGDWVGISYQRPLQVTFNSPQYVGGVGRRRKVTDRHRALYTSQQAPLTSPFMTRPRPPSLQDFESRSQRGKTDVRIHIGDRVVPPGISPSTAPSRKSRGHSTYQQIKDKPRIASSDIMLLDTEEVPTSISSRLMNEIQFSDQQPENLESNSYHETYSPTSQDLENENGNHELSRDQEHFHSWEGHNLEDGSSTTEAETEPSGHISEESPVLGIPFSPTLIKHPIPQSSKVSSILNSGSSEIANSTAGQVGKARPVVPSSQVLDNEIWETWMVPLYEDNCQHEDEEDSVVQESSISPGVSTAPERYQKVPKVPVEHEVEDFGEAKKAFRMTNPSSIREFSLDENDIEGWEPPRNLSRRKLEVPNRMIGGQDPVINIRKLGKKGLGISNLERRGVKFGMENRNNLRLSSAGLQEIPASHGLSTAKSKKGEGPDDIWRMFVFGTSSDEANKLGSPFEPTTPPKTERQKLLASSMEGNHSIELSAQSPTYSLHQNSNTRNRPDSPYKSKTPNKVSNVSTAVASPIDPPWNQSTAVRSTRNRVGSTDHNSLHHFDDSSNSENDNPVQVTRVSTTSSISSRAAASMAAGIASSQSAVSKSSETPHSPTPQKFVFTLPKRYEELKPASQSSAEHDEPLYIGRGLAKDVGAKPKKTKERDIYSLVDSDEILDD